MHSSRQDFTAKLDVSGLHCPQPVIKCKAMLATLDTGDTLHMISTDRDAPREIKQLIIFSGNRLCSHQIIDNRHHFQIEKCTPRSRHKICSTLTSIKISITDYFQCGFSFLYRSSSLTSEASRIIKGNQYGI